MVPGSRCTSGPLNELFRKYSIFIGLACISYINIKNYIIVKKIIEI